MVGLPGSGKSTVANNLAMLTRGHVVSADDCPGRYTRGEDGTLLYHPEVQAHAWAQERVQALLAAGALTVVVDNTNLVQEHRDIYVRMAEEHGYRVFLCWIGDGGLSDEELAARNQHGVPLDGIRRMRGLLTQEVLA